MANQASAIDAVHHRDERQGGLNVQHRIKHIVHGAPHQPLKVLEQFSDGLGWGVGDEMGKHSPSASRVVNAW